MLTRKQKEIAERNQQILALHKDGVKIRRIATRLGLSYAQTWWIIRRTDWTAESPPKRELYLRRVSKAVGLVAEGMSISKASAMCSISAPTLSRYVHVAGVKVTYGCHRDLSAAKAKAREMRRDGRTVTQIIQALMQDGERVSRGWVNRHCAGNTNEIERQSAA